MRYTAVIERPDGSTYLQGYNEFEDLVDMLRFLGDYIVVDIF